MASVKPPEPRRIIRDRQIVEDEWRAVPDDAPVPAGDVIVSRARWLTSKAELADRAGRLGVRFPSDQNPVFDDGVADLDLVAVEFPKFADGRGYTYARQLRVQLGFEGELRAVGDVLRDQLLPLARCGFDSFEVRADKSLTDALAAFGEFSVAYQVDQPE